MRPRGVNPLIEGYGRAEQRFERHRARHVGETGEARRPPQRKCADGRQRLRAVEERETFLALQSHWLDHGAAERLATTHSFSAKDRFTLADDAEREVRKRREIAAGAY